MEWLNRMTSALDRIETGLEDRLDIEEIAKAAHSSPFHFQRMFLMLTGMTVAEYARKRKLTLAAQELASSPVRVLDVALKYGYDSQESFAKAFRKVHGVSPSEARQLGAGLKAFPRLSFHLSLKGDKGMDYRIMEKEGFTVAGKALATTCQEGQNQREIPAFWGACNQDGTTARIAAFAKGPLYGICMDMKPGSDTFTYLIAAETDLDTLPEGFTARTIPASTWAVFPCVGPMPHTIQDTFGRIYQEWFPSTNYEHAGTPEMEVYPDDRDPSTPDYRTEIWIPIKKK